MVESFLTHDIVIKGEPSLDEYLGIHSNWDEIKDESFREMLLDLKNQNLSLRKLCKRYSLESSVTKTAAYDGSWTTDEDYQERLRLVIDVTALTGEAVFQLLGRDNSSGTGTEVVYEAITEAGKHTFLLNDVYKYYQLKLISVGTTITYSAYLIEDTYTELHKLKTRAKIYHSLMATDGGEYQGKFEQYQSLYNNYLVNSKFVYDEDDSGDVSEDEAETNINQDIRFTTR